MILPAVRERLEAVLRHPAMEGAVNSLRAGGQHVSLSGLHDVAKALVAAYATHALRRPAFFITDSNRRAEALAETVRFFANVFPGAAGGTATLPAFDTLPWEAPGSIRMRLFICRSRARWPPTPKFRWRK